MLKARDVRKALPDYQQQSVIDEKILENKFKKIDVLSI
jgi:hypothetical protein